MPTNPRPPRKRTSRTSTPRVAGRRRPTTGPEADTTPDTDATPADRAAAAAPADSNPVPSESAVDPVESTTDTSESVVEPSESPTDAAETGTEAVEGATDTAESTTESVESTTEPVDGTDVPTEKPKPAGKTRPVSRVSTLRPGDGSSSAASTSKSGGTASSKTSSRRPGTRRSGTIVALVVAAIVLGVFALIAGFHPGATIGANKAFVDQPATTELTSQVQSKACALTVDTVDVDKWANKARSVLTGTALGDFDKYLPQQRQILAQTKQVADCRVESVGVADLSGGDDGATARVVVNMIVSQQQAGIAGQSAAPRYQFGMVRRGDDWLISEVEAF